MKNTIISGQFSRLIVIYDIYILTNCKILRLIQKMIQYLSVVYETLV